MRKYFNYTFLLLALVLRPLVGNCQYFGGISNGFGSNSTLSLNLNLVDSLYNGGLSNGFITTTNTSTNLSLADSLYNGGIGTGYFTNNINTNLAIHDSLYNGGIGKGDNNIALKYIRLSTCNDSFLVWNGNTNVFWNNANNWDCSTVPFATSIVAIPFNATRMPVIASNAIASSLTILPNARLNLIGGGSLLTLTGQ